MVSKITQKIAPKIALKMVSKITQKIAPKMAQFFYLKSVVAHQNILPFFLFLVHDKGLFYTGDHSQSYVWRFA